MPWGLLIGGALANLWLLRGAVRRVVEANPQTNAISARPPRARSSGYLRRAIPDAGRQ